jgi:hypothetical protein
MQSGDDCDIDIRGDQHCVALHAGSIRAADPKAFHAANGPNLA